MDHLVKRDQEKAGLEFAKGGEDNDTMVIPGRVQSGVVVLHGGISLPESTEVTVTCTRAPAVRPAGEQSRVEFPLVRSQFPGSANLTAERIAEILEEEDVSS